MQESAITAAGNKQFNPREWLRKEVLWGYLMCPYDLQWGGWLNKDVTEAYHHQSNESRYKLYSAQEDDKLQVLGFINQGKFGTAYIFDLYS